MTMDFWKRWKLEWATPRNIRLFSLYIHLQSIYPPITIDTRISPYFLPIPRLFCFLPDIIFLLIRFIPSLFLYNRYIIKYTSSLVQDIFSVFYFDLPVGLVFRGIHESSTLIEFLIVSKVRPLIVKIFWWNSNPTSLLVIIR